MFNEIMEYHDYTDMDLVDFNNDWGGITFPTDINTESIVSLSDTITYENWKKR